MVWYKRILVGVIALIILLSGIKVAGFFKQTNTVGNTPVFTSFQTGLLPTAGDVLQTDGIHSTWVATSSLGFSGSSYTASGTLLDLTGTEFSVNEGTLTNGKICTYVTGTGLVCDYTDIAGSGATTTINGVSGPTFTFSTSSDTNVAIAISPSLQWQISWLGTLASSRIASSSEWTTAYGWGNHALGGYLTSGTERNDYQTHSTPIVQSSSLHVFGDSIAMGYNASDRDVYGYGALIASDMGATETNYAVSGSGGCDAAHTQIFPNENPGSTSSPVFILQTGDNDGFYKGLSWEPVYKLCMNANTTWLAIPYQHKVFGQSGDVGQTGTWANDDTYQTGIGIKSTTASSTLSFPITTYGDTIYIWYRIIDSNGGKFLYAVDSGATTEVTNYTSPAINTGIGNTQAVGVVRITGVASGAHTIDIEVSSATGASNIVSVLGVGTVPHLEYYRSPKVYVGGVPERQDEDVPTYNTAAYNEFNQEIVTEIQGDGLPVYFVDIRNHITTSVDDLDDVVHPSDLGHSKIRDAFEGVMQFTPISGGSVDLSSYMTHSYGSSTFYAKTLTSGYVGYGSSTGSLLNSIIFQLDTAGVEAGAGTEVASATGGSGDMNVDSTQQAAQCFQPSATGDLTQASVRAKKTGTVSGTYTYAIYNVTGTYGSTCKPTGSAIATSDTGVTSSLTTTYAEAVLLFSGANQITLTSGNTYAIAVHYTATAWPNAILIQNGTPSYHSGNLSYYASGSWGTLGTYDMDFTVDIAGSGGSAGSQYVGIGTTTPETVLSVVGTTTMQNQTLTGTVNWWGQIWTSLATFVSYIRGLITENITGMTFSSGQLSIDAGYKLLTDTASTTWDTAYTDRLKWDGGATGLVAATGRTSLGLGTMSLEPNTGSTTITTLGTIIAGIWNGTSLSKIATSTNPTINAGNTLGINTTAASSSVRYYDGTAERALFDVQEKCFTTASTTFGSYDDIPLWLPERNLTVTSMTCKASGGTSVVATLSDGTNNMDSLTCATTKTDDDGTIANASVTSGEQLEVDFGTVTGTVNWVNYCISYRYEAD